MKKIVLIILMFLFLVPSYAGTEATSETIKETKFSITKPIVEKIVQNYIQKKAKEELGKKSKVKVKFESYSIATLKKGIFKYFEITGKNVLYEGIHVPYMNLKTISDYNWIDYEKNPVEFKSDMVFNYELHLDEQAISDALNNEKYKSNLNNVNNLMHPFFAVRNVDIKINDNRVYIYVQYSVPLVNINKEYKMAIVSDFKVSNGRIKPDNLRIEQGYRNISLRKITHLINLLDPLTYTLKILENKQCTANIEYIKIDDNVIKVSGKVLVKGK